MIRLFLLILAISLASSGAAFALTDEEIFRAFRFNLVNPGARSLALGGAFVSLADDATAARANPAGLSYLLKREFFAELRHIDNSGEVAGIRDNLPAGGTTNVLTVTDFEDVTNVSFASAVFPIRNITLAISAQVALDTANSTLNRFDFAFDTGTPPVSTTTTQGAGSIDARQTNVTGSIGIRVSDQLAFGASFGYSKLDVESEVVNVIFDPNGNFGTPVIEPTLNLRTSIDDSDSSYGFAVGVIGRPHERVNLGAVYRRAPEFTLTQKIDPGLDTFGVQAQYGDQVDNRFNIPDSYALGASWRATDNLTFALDVERIEYSVLVKGFVPGVNALTDFDAVFTADDVTEYRLGGEYVVFTKGGIPLALRAGVFTLGDYSVRAVDTGTNALATSDAFPGRDREYRGALGLGIGLKRQQIDLAAAFGDVDNEFVVSYIFRGK